MRSQLSAEEIAALGLPVERCTEHLESVHVIERGDVLSCEVRLTGLADALCPPYFFVSMFDIQADSCTIQWSLRLPNGFERLLETEDQHHGRIEDPATLRFALKRALELGLSWRETFRNIALPKEVADTVAFISSAVADVMARLETVAADAGALSDEARAALNEAVREMDLLPVPIASLAGFVAVPKPVQY